MIVLSIFSLLASDGCSSSFIGQKVFAFCLALFLSLLNIVFVIVEQHLSGNNRMMQWFMINDYQTNFCRLFFTAFLPFVFSLCFACTYIHHCMIFRITLSFIYDDCWLPCTIFYVWSIYGIHHDDHFTTFGSLFNLLNDLTILLYILRLKASPDFISSIPDGISSSYFLQITDECALDMMTEWYNTLLDNFSGCSSLCSYQLFFTMFLPKWMFIVMAELHCHSSVAIFGRCKFWSGGKWQIDVNNCGYFCRQILTSCFSLCFLPVFLHCVLLNKCYQYFVSHCRLMCNFETFTEHLLMLA